MFFQGETLFVIRLIITWACSLWLFMTIWTHLQVLGLGVALQVQAGETVTWGHLAGPSSRLPSLTPSLAGIPRLNRLFTQASQSWTISHPLSLSLLTVRASFQMFSPGSSSSRISSLSSDPSLSGCLSFSLYGWCAWVLSLMCLLFLRFLPFLGLRSFFWSESRV